MVEEVARLMESYIFLRSKVINEVLTLILEAHLPIATYDMKHPKDVILFDQTDALFVDPLKVWLGSQAHLEIHCRHC